MAGEDLTNQQKSRLRRAYREAFDSQDRIKAVAMFYERFTAFYGLTVDELWDFVSDERTKREQPAALAAREPTVKKARKQPSPRNAAASATKQPEKTPLPSRRKLKRPSGMTVCPACGRMVGRSGLNKHKSPNRQYWCNGIVVLKPKREKRTCRTCYKSFSVRKSDGRMVTHKGKDGRMCKGSGRTPFEGRGSQYMKVAPMKLVRGGLPGLGRRR